MTAGRGRPGSPRPLLGLVVFVAIAFGVQRGVQGWQDDREAAQIVQSARPGDIQMLSSETCPYCAEARAWFTARRVPFAECFIERDAACAERFQALAGPGTPVLVVRGRRIVGFDRARVAEALQ